ncbi:MAG: 4-hydroxyacetophenone monooxygenase, partial [Acidimicrobiaceae bacterium]|nr:4-hydroxyacetophenone monooxygenase [Acidimicrobiaceae bacterium]
MKDLGDTTDAEIDQHLLAGDPMTLRAVVYQLTGDRAILATSPGEVPGMFGPVKALTDPNDVHLVRSAAAAYLRAHRDREAPLGDHGSPDRLATSLELAVGDEIPQPALEFCVEELAIEPIPRRYELQHAPDGVGDFHVVVIGSGVGGINAAINLKESGIPFTVLDKNSDVGGTWHDNRYPGCRVDIASRAYSHTFGLHYPWSHWFAPQSENNGYLQWCVDTFNVRDHIRFDTEVTSLAWDDNSARWTVAYKDADGQPGTMTANVVISAVGFLSRPKFPAIEGMDTFTGPSFHTAWWDQDLDPKGKHFGVIGTGCSGMQLVPELERMGATVTVFQRRPSWVFEVPIYRDELPEGVKWLDRNLALFRNFEKFRAIWAVGDHVNATPFFKDPEWSDPDSLSAINSRARQVSLNYLQRKLADRPDLLDASVPNSPAMASRPVIDNGWLDAITGPNVELVTEPIARIGSQGIVTASSRTIEVDVIVYA